MRKRVKGSVVLAAATASALVASGAAWAAAQAAVAALHPAPAIARAADGHYWAVAEVNGRPVRVLVDTGATAVALTVDDARRLGLHPERMNFSRRLATASGAAHAAPVTLDVVQVGAARLETVSALVVSEGLSSSLLGMSYLGRLSSFSADRDGLVLRR